MVKVSQEATESIEAEFAKDSQRSNSVPQDHESKPEIAKDVPAGSEKELNKIETLKKLMTYEKKPIQSKSPAEL